MNRWSLARASWLILDLALAGALVWLGVPVASQAYERSQIEDELELVGREAHDLYDAMCGFYSGDAGSASSRDETYVDLRSLRPLRLRGYYRGPITNHLLNYRADAFDAPVGPNAQRDFWMEMTLRRDPSIRILVARSDKAPLAGGRWRDGVFVYREGKLEAF